MSTFLVYVYVFLCVYVCAHSTLSIFLNLSPPYFVKHGFSLNLEFTDSAWLAGQQTPGSFSSPYPSTGITGACFSKQEWSKLKSLYFWASTLPTKPSPATLSRVSELCLWGFVFLGTNRGFHGTGSRSKFVWEITLLLGFLLTRTRKWDRNSNEIWAWRCLPAVPALRSQGRRDNKFKGSLLCTTSFRRTRAS